MPLPPEQSFHAEHLWVRPLPDGSALVGISSYAAERLGEVVYVDYPRPGSDITQGTAFGTIESSKVVSDLVAPVSGSVLETSEGVDQALERINGDPQGEGWVLRVRPAADPGPDPLLSLEQYRRQLSDPG
jgi:glycine cleavage system H protein